MHPEIIRFSYFGAERVIYSYGAMIVAGMAAGIGLAALRGPRYGIARFDALAVGLLSVVGGITGAALLYLLINLPTFLADPVGFLRAPGMVFYGGFLGAFAAAGPYIRHYRVPLGAMADVAAPCLPLGHAIGRIGCFLGGCCYGRPTSSSLGVVFTDPRVPATALSQAAGPIHPVQLYESAGLLVIGVGLLIVSRLARRWPRGMLLPLYMITYAVLRLVTERFRGDDVERKFLVPGLLSTSQAIAVALLAVGVGLLVYLGRRGRTAARP